MSAQVDNFKSTALSSWHLADLALILQKIPYWQCIDRT
jgi:hypothetical protein